MKITKTQIRRIIKEEMEDYDFEMRAPTIAPNRVKYVQGILDSLAQALAGDAKEAQQALAQALNDVGYDGRRPGNQRIRSE